MTTPTPVLDPRFGDAAEAPPWEEVSGALAAAELYWLSTVRADGRPHVTPVVGVWDGAAFWFCTGPGEQKARNLDHSRLVAVTTGSNSWASGTDVVVEGTAERVTEVDRLQRAVDVWFAKYGEAWRFHVDPRGGFEAPEGPALVFRVVPDKVIAFAKDPHGQTTYRFR